MYKQQQNARRVRPRRHIAVWPDVSHSDDELTHDSWNKGPLPCDSRSYIDGALQSLENSQASLNKRLASFACLDEHSGPTDFRFLLEGGMSAEEAGRLTPEISLDAESLAEEASIDIQAVIETLVAKEPPLSFDDDGTHWVNSQISKSSELIDGQAWIAEYERRITEARAKPENSTLRDLPLRNRVLKEMGSVSPPGRKVALSTGQEVIFWFNVGAPGPPRSRVYVTEAHCPHQHVCLLGAELMEIEDLASGRRALTRCPRHNKRFDLCSGESAGNAESLQRYPCRFEHGCWYVGVGPAQPAAETSVSARGASDLPERDGCVPTRAESRHSGMVAKCGKPMRKKARLTSEIGYPSSENLTPPKGETSITSTVVQ